MSDDIVFGTHAVSEALRARGSVNHLYLGKDTKVRNAESLVALARDAGVPFDFVPVAKLNSMTGTGEHQGVAAKVSPVAYTPLDDWLRTRGRKAILVVLDQVQHPRNLGMVLRTAACAGAAGVMIPARGGALLDADVVRSSAGAVFHVPVIQGGNLAQSLRACQEAGFWAYALDPAGEASVFSTDWAGRSALVVGNETHGVRLVIRKACDVSVRIPMAGGFDSLNAAVAVSVALFQVAAHHAASE